MIRTLGPWGIATLVLVYLVVGAAVSSPFQNKGSFAAVAVANVAGVAGAVLYLRFWRGRAKHLE